MIHPHAPMFLFMGLNMNPALLEVVLVFRAQVVFPMKNYLDPKAVRHARREWVKAKLYLMTD